MVRTPPGANPIQAEGGIPKNLGPAINEIMQKGNLEGSVAAYKAAPLVSATRSLESTTEKLAAMSARMENSNSDYVLLALVTGATAVWADSTLENKKRERLERKEASRVKRIKESQIWDLREKGLEIGAWMSGASSSPPVFLGR
jgi:hypothetical protein